MSSVSRVPLSTDTHRGAVSARDAWKAVRSHGLWHLVRASFSRFRFGDGFSHARALGFQLALAVLPLLIASIGVSGLLEAPSLRLVLRRTILELTPGASDALVRSALPARGDGSGVDASALAFGVIFALVALTTAMGQLERGANRIYGIQRDRPSVAKYGRGLLMASAAGLPLVGGSILLIAANTFAEAMESQYALDDDLVALVAWPVGVALVLGAITAMLRLGPARRQPAWSLLVLSGVLSFTSWTAFTLLLAGFLRLSSELGSIYGPLTGVIALLIWAQMASASILLGFAVSAEIEAVVVD